MKKLALAALLATVGTLEAEELRQALRRTFEGRGTHPLPAVLPAPPAAWAPVYARMAVNDALAWTDLEELFEAVQAFLGPRYGDIGQPFPQRLSGLGPAHAVRNPG